MTIDWHGRSMTPRTEVARRMRHADSSVGQTGSLGLRAIGCDLPRRLAAVSNPARHAGRANRDRPRIRRSLCSLGSATAALVNGLNVVQIAAALLFGTSARLRWPGILSHSGVPWSLRPDLGRLDLHPGRRRSDPCSRTGADQPLGNAHPPIQVVNTDQVESLRRSRPRADVGPSATRSGGCR
jgi:hypothetical protein